MALIPAHSMLLCNGQVELRAMDNKEIRRANMLGLVSELGTLKALADKTGTDPAHLSQIKNRVRAMGDDVARRFEQRLRKPHGWMDIIQDKRVAQEPESYRELVYSNIKPLRARVPLISWAEAAVWPYGEDKSRVLAGGEVATTAEVGPDAFALQVVGDAMEPRIPDGSTLIVDPARHADKGAIVLVQLPGDSDVILRQLWYDGTTPKLRPLNARYTILDMPPGTRIIGVAVQVQLDL